MAEDEAARHLGRADEVEVEQVVERRRAPRASGRPAISAARSGSNGSPATAAPSSSAREGADSDSSSPAIAPATAAGTPASRSRVAVDAPGQVALARGAAELLEVERVAAAVAVDRGHRGGVHVAEQLRRLGLAELV